MPGDLVINEVFGGGGNTGAPYNADFVELYNPTNAPISLAGRGLQYRSAAGGSGGVATLSGSVPAGSTFLIQTTAAGSVGAALDPDLVTSTVLGMSGTAGQVLLLTTPTAYTGAAGDTTSATTVIDMLGFGPATTTFEGAPTTANQSNTTSGSRNANHTDTNNNAADFTNGTPTPTKSGGGTTTPGDLAATNPGNKTAVTGTAITPFTLAATGGTSPYTWTATGLPDGLSISSAGQVSGTPTAAGTSTVTATVTDSAATPATATTTFTYTVTAPGAELTIAEIQGTTATTPYANQTVTTTGVVTAAFPTGGLNGFYIQTGGTDTTPDASDAVFVYAGTNIPAASYPAKGSTVTVTGTAVEFGTFGLTEINVAGASAVTTAATAQPAVVAKTVVPGTDCVQGSCLSASALATAREKVEGELFAPTGKYTTTDVYDGSPYPSTSTANFGELGLAAESTRALVAPSDLYDVQNEAAQVTARTAYNDAHRIIMDDGSSLNYTLAANTGSPLPWFTPTHYVRNNAAVTFPEPVVLTVGFDGATFVPSGGQITGDPTGKVNFAQNRPEAPGEVGGEIKLATANVLNYFPTTGEEFVSQNGGTCSYYTDRAGNRITNNQCDPNGPRGAANAANLQRQQDKIVHELNSLDASILSLEEVENSIFYGKPRDFALSTLVDALNDDAGAGTWAFAPSPAAADLPAQSEQDVIRTAFVYKPSEVSLVGASKVLVGSAPFGNAREPLAQGFKKVGDPDSNAFAVVVNHFKSKGSGTNDGTGQGNANPDRVNQAAALKTFAASFSTSLGGSGAVFLTGDFNAYSHEDPVQKIEENGDYTELQSTTTPGEDSYNFGGLDGSLDHVFANAAAEELVTGVDIWNINGDESVYQEYSRFNYNVTNLYNTEPYRASDHNPEIIGLTTSAAGETPVDVQILATNDFHGRIQNDTSSGSAGAAVLAGAVKQFKAANPATSFVAAGDLIGASTFESFIQNDEPTIDALNEAGLDVSAVGNHEFDKGYDDLVNRVMDRAEWTYIGANVKMRASGDPALEPSFVMNQGGVEVGYVGAVTEHLPELVAPGGIADIEVTNIANAVNAEADALKADGVDVVVLLVHEGAAGTDCATINSDTTSDFGKITSAVNGNVDAIVSGHTHLVYNCSQPVSSWANRPVTTRPIVSAGQYGTNLNKINFSVDATTGVVEAKTQSVLPLKSGTTGSTFNYPVDSATQSIVTTAVQQAEVLGAQVIGQIGGAYNRAKLADGTTENRGGESTLGNLVAEIQREQTSGSNRGAAQIAFMNPGGLRADLAGTVNGSSRDVTYKQAANVQPFANTLVNEALTGAQIKAALEQQWQPSGASRPFLKLGISKGFRYTYDPSAAQGSRIKTMSLNGTPIVLTDTYSVTVNSFLSTGGDNFTALNGTGRKQDTGVTDLQAQVDYFDAQTAPLAVDYSQRGVGVSIPSTDPETYPAGSTVTVNLSSLSMTGPNDLVDANVTATIDGQSVGSFPVTTTLQTALPGFDEVGTATAEVELPSNLAGGTHEIVFTGDKTGTVVKVPVEVEAAPGVGTTISATAADIVYGKAGSVSVTVTATGSDATPTGEVELRDGEDVLDSATLVDGKATFTLEARALEVGSHPLTVAYAGDDGFDPSTTEVTVTVVKATTTVTATSSPTSVTVLRSRNTVTAAVTADGYTPTGTVEIRRGSTVLGTGELNSQGRVAIRVGPYASVGTATLTVVYRGDERASSDTTTVQVKVIKQTPTLTITTVASARKGTQPTVKVAVTGDGAVVTGRASFTVGGKTATITLVNGKAQYKMPKITKDTAVTVRYNGSTTFNTVSKRIVIKLR
nr:ExeM/NucH family extracellular endonuclease [Nocardioides plantarum]